MISARTPNSEAPLVLPLRARGRPTGRRLVVVGSLTASDRSQQVTLVCLMGGGARVSSA
jgi:hypothetical protein